VKDPPHGVASYLSPESRRRRHTWNPEPTPVSQSAELAIDRVVDLPRGFAYVEYETRAEAEKAKLHMNGGQLDGNVITCVSQPSRFLGSKAGRVESCGITDKVNASSRNQSRCTHLVWWWTAIEEIPCAQRFLGTFCVDSLGVTFLNPLSAGQADSYLSGFIALKFKPMF
jgi:RNA recognition motif-containing protein